MAGPAQTLRCFHCGEAVPAGAPWQIQFDGESRPLCCGGCEAVAGTILAAGLEAFYRQRPAQDKAAALARDLPATLSQAAEVGAINHLFAETDAQDASSASSADDASGSPTTRVDLAIEGMHCGACVWLLEQGLQGLPGVQRASVNLATERASLEVDLSRSDLTAVLSRVARLGYRASPHRQTEGATGVAGAQRTSLQRLFVAGIGMMQVMMVALPAYLADAGDIETQYADLLRWAALVLTTPVILYSAWPFFNSAWQNLRFGRVGIDVPVSIGLAAAYLWSVRATLTGQGEVYFDSVTMFVFLLLLARHLQWVVRRRSLARLASIGARTPLIATQLVDGLKKSVSPARLQPGDEIIVTTGQTVPVDGCLLAAATSIDQSMLTGESVPVALEAGAPIAAGSIVTGPPARLQVTQALADSAVSQLETLVARGFDEKPRWVMLADRIASYFVIGVMALAALVWVAWMNIDPAQAWPIAMTVLVVSCPCALSLATPSALSAASGGLMGQGLLVTRADALEALASATDIVFDKTGTLTEGRPALDTMTTSDGLEPAQALALAAALEQGSDHPFARALREAALRRAAESSAVTVTVTDHQSGLGVAGESTGPEGLRQWRLGSALWCGLTPAAQAQAGVPSGARASSEVWLVELIGAAATPVYRARFGLSDPLRANARQTIEALAAQGLRLHLLSGDQPAVARQVGASLGIDSVTAGALPAQKQAFVRALQTEGRQVVMVGDGMNDAPVLSLANASVAIGQASDLARTAADVIALAGDPAALVTLLDRAAATRRIIKQNLGWALVYNATMVPAAALGWVPPWAAAIGMAASSWLVVANAARLWRPRGGAGAAQAPADAAVMRASARAV